MERPRKAIVNKDLRVRALREHWDEREIHLARRPSNNPKPLRWVDPCLVKFALSLTWFV